MTTFAVKQKLLSLTGQSMSIKDNEGNLIASIDGKIFSLRDRCVIFGADGRPACCIIQKILSMSPAYFIYSFKPYFNGQKPTGEKQDGKDLYAWAKVWKRLVAVTDEFEICMAVNDNEYQQPEHGLFKAVAPSMLSPKLMVSSSVFTRQCAQDVCTHPVLCGWSVHVWSLTPRGLHMIGEERWPRLRSGGAQGDRLRRAD